MSIHTMYFGKEIDDIMFAFYPIDMKLDSIKV